MKNNYFYKKPLSNIYKKPHVVSEVTSQILYGEKFKIISKNKSWIKIKALCDNYTGYIKNKDYTKDHQPTHKIFTLKANIYNKQKNKTKYFLPFASRFSIIQENRNFIEFEKNVDDYIEKYGKMPLPPYINREAQESDKISYQTVTCLIS